MTSVQVKDLYTKPFNCITKCNLCVSGNQKESPTTYGFQVLFDWKDKDIEDNCTSWLVACLISSNGDGLSRGSLLFVSYYKRFHPIQAQCWINEKESSKEGYKRWVWENRGSKIQKEAARQWEQHHAQECDELLHVSKFELLCLCFVFVSMNIAVIIALFIPILTLSLSCISN